MDGFIEVIEDAWDWVSLRPQVLVCGVAALLIAPVMPKVFSAMQLQGDSISTTTALLQSSSRALDQAGAAGAQRCQAVGAAETADFAVGDRTYHPASIANGDPRPCGSGSGDTRWVVNKTSLAIVDGNGVVVQVVPLSRDESIQKQFNELLRATEANRTGNVGTGVR